MKKRVLAILLASAMVMAMTGCGGSSAKADQPTQETETAEETEGNGAETGEDGTDAAVETEEAAPAAEADAAEESLPYNELVPVMSYEEYMEADLDSPVTVETYVQAKQAYYAEQSTATLYTQNEEGAYFVYNLPITQSDYDRLVEGQKIKISGYKSEWSGEVEIVDATYEIEDGNYIAEAKDVTDLLGSDELAQYQNQKIALKGMKSVDIEDIGGDLLRFLYNSEGTGDTGDDLYFCMEKNGETYTFTVESYLCGPETEVYQTIETLDMDAVVDLEGYLYWYEGPNPHITSVTPAQE